MASFKGTSKRAGKRKALLVAAALLVLCIACYAIADHFIFESKKAEITDLATDYIADLQTLNTYEQKDKLSEDSVLKKKNQAKTLMGKYMISQAQIDSYADCMGHIVSDMREKNGKIDSFAASSIRVKEIYKYPWEMQGNIRILYRLDYRYHVCAGLFNGADFTFVDDDGTAEKQGTQYCLLSLELKQQGGAMKIARVAGILTSDQEENLEK